MSINENIYKKYIKTNQRVSYNSALNHQTQYFYNQNRKLTQIIRPSGKTVDNNYINDRLNRTTTAESTINYSYIFNDKIDTITKDSESIKYNYDGDLITSVVQSGVLNQTVSYSYNNDFKVNSTIYAGVSQNYTYDNDGLLLSSGGYNLIRDIDNGDTFRANINSYPSIIGRKMAIRINGIDTPEIRGK